jgi:hypothetical protein
MVRWSAREGVAVVIRVNYDSHSRKQCQGRILSVNMNLHPFPPVSRLDSSPGFDPGIVPE